MLGGGRRPRPLSRPAQQPRGARRRSSPPAPATPLRGGGRPPPCTAAGERAGSPRGAPSPGRSEAGGAGGGQAGGGAAGQPAGPRAAPEEAGVRSRKGPQPPSHRSSRGWLRGAGGSPLLSPLLQRRPGAERRRQRSFAVSPRAARSRWLRRPGDRALRPRGAGLPPPRASERASERWRGRCWGGRSASSRRPALRAGDRQPAGRPAGPRSSPPSGANRPPAPPAAIAPPEPRGERGSASAQLLALRPRQRHSGRRALMNIYSERRRAPPPSPRPPISRGRAEGRGGRPRPSLRWSRRPEPRRCGRCSVPLSRRRGDVAVGHFF